jgi:hypothetical protein
MIETQSQEERQKRETAERENQITIIGEQLKKLGALPAIWRNGVPHYPLQFIGTKRQIAKLRKRLMHDP